MRRTWGFLLLLLLPSALSAQGDTLTRASLTVMAERGAIAEWLLQYDAVAWISSDSVVAAPDSLKARLGPEWFADTARGSWHVFYGSYDVTVDRYSIAFHYSGPSARTLRSSTEDVDTLRVLASARALYSTQARLPADFAPAGLRFNQYLRRPTSDTLEVWLLPAFQTNGLLVIGSEATYRWDRLGSRLVDSTLRIARYRAFRPDTTVEATVAAEDAEYPTVGHLFFLRAYSSYFRKLAIRTQRLYTTVFNGPDGPALISALRDSTP